MLRFVPDGWLEGLLRPFLMIDPVASVYSENSAPDWRIAAFIVLMAVALIRGPARAGLSSHQAVTALGFVLLTYLWTYSTGNGRYFISGLVLAGPLLVLACWQLPGSPLLRAGVLAGVLATQGIAMGLSYERDPWGMVHVSGEPLPIERSEWRERPAVFLTLSPISYSILVPQFHPQSRWANVAGQRHIVPGVPEYARLRELLASPLPKALVVPVKADSISAQGQPTGAALRLIDDTLGLHGLGLVPQGCRTLRSGLVAPGPLDTPQARAAPRGFWICELQEVERRRAGDTAIEQAASRLADVFARIEQRCPRFFAPGDGRPSLVDSTVARFYVSSDVRVHVDPAAQVYYQHHRAMRPTLIGSVDAIRAGQFELACDKLPGRYLPPWARE